MELIVKDKIVDQPVSLAARNIEHFCWFARLEYQAVHQYGIGNKVLMVGF